MAEVTIHMNQIFSTVDDLQNECNFKAGIIPGGKLKTLKAVGDAAAHVTDGVFERTAGAPFGATNLTIKLDPAGTNTAWIGGKEEKVSF